MERLVTMTINVALVVAHAVMTVTQEVQEQDVARKFNDFYPSFAKDNYASHNIVLHLKFIS